MGYRLGVEEQKNKGENAIMSETETNGTVTQPQEIINNYLVPAIISTLCCCPPTGIVSIVFAAQVNSKQSAGDIAGAKDAASKAFVSIGIGLVLWAINLFLQFVLPLILGLFAAVAAE